MDSETLRRTPESMHTPFNSREPSPVRGPDQLSDTRAELSSPVPTTRTPRKRKAPKRFSDEMDIPPPAKHSKAPKGEQKAKSTPRTWETNHLLQSSTSKLTQVDLRKILFDDCALNSLTQDQLVELMNIVPHLPKSDDAENARHVLKASLMYDEVFRTSLREFQEDLACGCYGPKWLEQAQKAFQERANGDFDAFKQEEYEQYWGQKAMSA